MHRLSLRTNYRKEGCSRFFVPHLLRRGRLTYGCGYRQRLSGYRQHRALLVRARRSREDHGPTTTFDPNQVLWTESPEAAVAALQDAPAHLRLPVDVDLHFRALLQLNLDAPTLVEKMTAFLQARHAR
jgi:hypothetical protein